MNNTGKKSVMDVEGPKVSIILPVYNGAKHLKNSIDSCLTQTYRNIELIIVDDCSTDSTPQVIKAYNDPRIKYICNKTNQRLPRSLNIGFAQASGDYLTWTSDDNQFVPHAIETMLRYLKERPEVDFVYTDNISKYLDTGETKKRNIGPLEQLKTRNCIGACYLYKRKVYEAIGGFDPNYELVEDYEYWVRVSRKFTMHYLPEALYIYGEHSGSLTGTRMASVQLFDKIMKYRYGFIATQVFVHCVFTFLESTFDTRKSLRQILGLWSRSARLIGGISFPLGIFFVCLALFVFIGKMTAFVIKKILWPYRRKVVEQKLRRVVAGLKRGDGKINILCAVNSMKVGGAQKVALDVARGLRDDPQYGFHLIASRHAEKISIDNFNGVFINQIELDELPDQKLYRRYFEEVIERLNIKVLLISHSAIAYHCLPYLKDRYKYLKVVDIVHLERVGPARDEMLWVDPYIDRRVCISDGIRRHMIAKIGGDNGKLTRFTTVYNGIDLTRYRDSAGLKGRFRAKHNISSDTKIVAFIARFSDEKNPLLFVDIAKGVLGRGWPFPVKFVMAGDGHLFAQVKAKIKDLGLEERIILTGMLDNIPELLADTHLLTVVSSNEGIPLTVMEAIAMNVPVVSTIVGATDEVLKGGVYGFLIPQSERMAGEFIDKITELLKDDRLHRSLSGNSKESFYREFSRETMSRRYSRVFEEILAGKSD